VYTRSALFEVGGGYPPESDGALPVALDILDVGVRARGRIGWHLLPFVFLLYVVAQLDRVNVSFAILRMNVDLGFGDQVYGISVAAFYLGYVVFEVPGALIVERWSARKWIARIMVSWGLMTMLCAFVRTAGQFYAVRFFLGLAEASFFPGMIVYLTRWFRLSDRRRAIAILYTHCRCLPCLEHRLRVGCWELDGTG
jgi:MFS family permease